MAVDKLVDSTQLDSDLTDVADEIRTAGGTLLPLSFPDDYVVAIGDIGNTEIKTASGSIAHFEDALARKAQDLTVAIEPIQDLHGYDNPWPAGGGVNLLDTSKRSASSAIGYGCTFSIDTNNVFRVTGTVSQQYPRIRFLNLGLPDLVLPAGTYKLVRLNQTGNFSPRLCDVLASKYLSTTPVTLTEETTFTTIISGTALTGETIDCSFQLMVVDGNAEAPTTYSPYSNICPISGHTDADVVRTGKNLLDPQILTSTNGNTYIMTLDYDTTGKISVKPNTTYTISIGKPTTASGDARVYGFNAEGTRSILATTFVRSTTFTTGADTVSLSFYCKVALFERIVDSEPMLELGSTATAYEPYQGQTYTIDLDGTRYGGTLDVTTGKLTVDRAMVDLGTLTWNKANTSSERWWFSATRADAKKAPSNNQKANCICSSYEIKTPNNLWDGQLGAGINASAPQIVVVDLSYDDANTFKTAMSGVQLCFELATPTVYDLTPTEVTTLLGTNNVWADTGDSTIKYIAPKAQIPSAQGVYF